MLTRLIIFFVLLSCQAIGQDTDQPQERSPYPSVRLTGSDSIIKSVLDLVSVFDLKSASFPIDTIKTKEGDDILVIENSTAGPTLAGLTTFRWTVIRRRSFAENVFYFSKKNNQLVCAIYTKSTLPDPRAEKQIKIPMQTEYQIFSNGNILSVLNSDKKKIELDRKELAKRNQETKLFFTNHITQIKLNN